MSTPESLDLKQTGGNPDMSDNTKITPKRGEVKKEGSAPETGNPALSKPWKLEKSFGGSDWKILYPDRRDASGFSILTFLPTAQTALAEFIVGAVNDKIAARSALARGGN